MAINGLMMFGATTRRLILGVPSTVLDTSPPLEKVMRLRL
jgi:hypothetical protein